MLFDFQQIMQEEYNISGVDVIFLVRLHPNRSQLRFNNLNI